MELFFDGLGNEGCVVNWRENIIRFLKDLIRPKTIREIILKELRQAHLRKLEAETGVEWAISIVTYNEKRIKRLQERLQHHEEDKE